ncbi:response regulator transcription factor [Dehalococcoides mccartyi]|uniref:DNA-binding response regulator, LuxR family n=1 Tax=Dehalococcoides mccartyi (strain VS) TaxID=311424 RepID=D2BJH2_DEHMV|nr:response regulator transcription factor [Dehalococcoides mccartyi]ACZ62472.1 DNA-binding response regulator, LuxR family [Dehalococcoides mccartyi VS]
MYSQENTNQKPAANSAGQTIKVVLIDDHEIVRQGLATMLQKEADICLVGDASDSSSGLDIIEKTNPDVVLLDIQLGNSDIDGFALAKKIKSKSPNRVVIMLTGFDSELYLTEALKSKVNGFILKEHPRLILACAIRMAYSGISIWDTKILYRALTNISKPKEEIADAPLVHKKFGTDLTDRERTILNLLAKGYSNKDIGQKLDYTQTTVKKYVYNCMKKLGVSNRTQLAILANNNGLQ